MFDQLHQHLAAIAQAAAFFKLVNKGDGLPGQRDHELMPPLRGKPAPIGAILVGDSIVGRYAWSLQRRACESLARMVNLALVAVY